MAKVLIIDDSLTVVHFVRRTLKQDGHIVDALESFVHLAAVMQRDPPDVIVLDLALPAMSGESMGAFIRKYQQQHVPIIIYSSRPEAEMLAARDILGATAYVSKAASDAALRDAVRRAVDTAHVRSGASGPANPTSRK